MTLIVARKRLSTIRNLAALVGLSLFAAAANTGCVSSEKYNARGLQSAQYAEDLAKAQRQNSELTAQNEIYRNQLSQIRNAGDSKDALFANQVQTIADLTRQRDELASKYRDAIDSLGKAGAGALPTVLTNELTAFAAQNPDQVEFDPKLGLVKFKSDFTFSPGSAEVKPEAKGAIAKLAGILNGPVASNYDLMVVGHTDNKPVSNPATIKAGHRDNWYLSAHRAIEVSKELRGQNVAGNRVQVAGCGEQRPVADNTSPSGMAKNRRVEVLLLPTSHSNSAVAQQSSPAGGAAQPAAAKPGLNKDVPPSPTNGAAAEIESRPMLQK